MGLGQAFDGEDGRWQSRRQVFVEVFKNGRIHARLVFIYEVGVVEWRLVLFRCDWGEMGKVLLGD